MSLGREITVWCDEPDCGEWGPQGNYATTAKEARAYAARLGWKRRDGRDFCPDHGSTEPARIAADAEAAHDDAEASTYPSDPSWG